MLQVATKGSMVLGALEMERHINGHGMESRQQYSPPSTHLDLRPNGGDGRAYSTPSMMLPPPSGMPTVSATLSEDHSVHTHAHTHTSAAPPLRPDELRRPAPTPTTPTTTTRRRRVTGAVAGGALRRHRIGREAAVADPFGGRLELAAARARHERVQLHQAAVQRAIHAIRDPAYERLPPGASLRVDWCLLLDDSGSMLPKAQAARMAVALVMEVLRRLEDDFAVVMFSKTSEVLKELRQPFDSRRGQLVWEAFKFSSGTYPATACEFVGRTIFPEQREAAAEGAAAPPRRVVLMLVDGMTFERDADDYHSALRQGDISLAVLNIAPPFRPLSVPQRTATGWPVPESSSTYPGKMGETCLDL
ncbi:hypothetical protein TSOC_012938 [Tetrabaena socialis]|uniref:VWFA domain-containing protein n=1 Tax=Tetrabaena socialis TaxID=47790 RepID=A0A2J7ZLM2_9CHLO|nr:hypothetical protein TSOC_012938 [Tetrabaena socialis]|eukprot:PNH01171.1 hypothetical protein TSOC_012938 [Tetrabaena socialis]